MLESQLKNRPPSLHQAAYDKAAKRLFFEALSLYLRAIRQRGLLLNHDKDLILLAIHGLGSLNNYPLARALIQLSFSYLTADELLNILQQAQYTQHSLDCQVPF